MSAAVDPATLKKLKEEAEERARLELRAQGTPVNEATFAAWRKTFDAEMRALKEASGEAAADSEMAAKVSGRAWFMEKDRPEAVEQAEDDDDEDFSDESGEEDDDEFTMEGDDDEDEDDFLDDYLGARQ